MRTRYLIRFGLLAIGFALTTAGILAWQEMHFNLDRLWPISAELSAHPVYLIVLGMALIPPTIWEIFVLENRNGDG